MKRQFEMFQGVVLVRDVKGSFASGFITYGTYGVVMDLLKHDGLAVEFFDAEDNTIDVVLMSEDDLRAETDAEAAVRQKRLAARTTA
jgi:hypothetical protein